MLAFGIEDLEVLAVDLAERRLELGHELRAFGDRANTLDPLKRPRGEDEDVRLARNRLMPIDRPEAAHRGGDSLFHAGDLIETSHRRTWDLEREEGLHESASYRRVSRRGCERGTRRLTRPY